MRVQSLLALLLPAPRSKPLGFGGLLLGLRERLVERRVEGHMTLAATSEILTAGADEQPPMARRWPVDKKK